MVVYKPPCVLFILRKVLSREQGKICQVSKSQNLRYVIKRCSDHHAGNARGPVLLQGLYPSISHQLNFVIWNLSRPGWD